ncbi:sensor histidine kinase [Dyadobacter sp. CY356]|uniref:sensor histidine kinase n=1 Tax=Dyadobacter sp. CY356 TaxID=2906442 RepID=UPI001F43EB68|nr:histidine kinase [Dyadobacter sp. CY356]MCF0056265.1 histidine kinase [Dyadobacter sp. CY356]
MKLRLSEFWLATLCWVLSIYHFLNNAFSASEPHKSYIGEMTQLFAQKGMVYNYSTYHLLPRLSVATGLYLSFIFLNNWVLPKYLPRKKWNIIVLFWLCAYAFLTMVYAGYYRHENILTSPSFGACLVDSAPDTFKIFLLFLAYTIVKNLILNFLVHDVHNQSLRTRIIREVIVVFLIWAAILFALLQSDYRDLAIFWFCIIPCGYFIYLFNLYYLIPDYKKEPEKLRGYTLRLLSTIIVSGFFSMIFLQILHQILPVMAFLTINFLVFTIAVVFSWFIYNQNKDQLQLLYSLKTELGKSSADLQFLRSQINPHFLFNILNTLYGTAIQESADRTSEGIQKLGDMMRFMLYENNLDMIPVAREVDYLKDYIHLQNLRLAKSENIKVEVNISENTCQHSIAPMLLIPFIENAYKHGISLQNRSWINISLRCENNKLELDVYNSIHTKNQSDTENENKGIGLDYVRQRLGLLYPSKYDLQIRASQIEYFVHLTLRFQ